MKRFHEEFGNLVMNQQVTYDPAGMGVGMIVDDDGKCLDYHPSYPGKNPLYLPMKEQNRQPSCDLSSSTLTGQALNHKFLFRVYKHTTGAGPILDSVATIAPGNGSRIRMGHDGARWYVYVCLPTGGITPTTEYSYFAALDDKWHDFSLAVRHNRIVGSFDSSQFTIPYTVSKAYNTPDALTWLVVLYSNPAFSVRYKNLDFAIQN